MKIELGGGSRPKGQGFVNVDVAAGCDVRFDLETAGATGRLPWPDGAADEIYSSHCLEHVVNVGGVLAEICRVGKVGCRVELRVPHWNGAMSRCPGHVHALSEQFWSNLTGPFAADWFPPGRAKKRLRLLHIEHIPGPAFGAWKGLFGGWADADIMRLCPDACHEIRVFLEVIANA